MTGKITRLPTKPAKAKAPQISDEIELSECKAVAMGEGGWHLMAEDDEGRPMHMWLWEKDMAKIADHPYSGLRDLLNIYACQYAPNAA